MDAVHRRYLRARRWNVVDAFKQFKETEDWRRANDLNVLYDTIDLEAYEASRRLYPQWTGRRDRRLVLNQRLTPVFHTWRKGSCIC